MANAPNPRGGSRQRFALRARRTTTLVGSRSRAVFAFVLLSTWSMSITQAEEAGHWRPRKTSIDSSTWSPDAAGRLLGDTLSANATRWLPSRPPSPLAKPANPRRGKSVDEVRSASPQLPRYAALRAEIDAIHADFSEAVKSNADPRQFDRILVRAFRVRDDAQTPSERALADELFERIAKFDAHVPREQRAELNAGKRSWLGNLSTEASGIGTLILTGHDEARPRPRNAPEHYSASSQPQAEHPSASNPVRGALTRLMSYTAMDRDGDEWLMSPFDSPREFSADRREPARFAPDGTIQRVAATESSSTPLPALPVQAAPTITEQIPLLKQLGDWWQSRTPRGERDER